VLVGLEASVTSSSRPLGGGVTLGSFERFAFDDPLTVVFVFGGSVKLLDSFLGDAFSSVEVGDGILAVASRAIGVSSSVGTLVLSEVRTELKPMP